MEECSNVAIYLRNYFNWYIRGFRTITPLKFGAKSDVFSQSYIEKFPIAFTSLLKKTVSKPVYQNNSKNIKLRLLVEKEHRIF